MLDRARPAAGLPILCVEDEPDLLDDLALELEDSGFAVIPAANAVEALAVLRSVAVGLVLCDVQLPGMNGIALLRQAVDLAPVGAYPVHAGRFVFLSAFSDADLAHEIAGLGAQLLLKPVDYDELIALVGAMQGGAQS